MCVLAKWGLASLHVCRCFKTDVKHSDLGLSHWSIGRLWVGLHRYMGRVPIGLWHRPIDRLWVGLHRSIDRVPIGLWDRPIGRVS